VRGRKINGLAGRIGPRIGAVALTSQYLPVEQRNQRAAPMSRRRADLAGRAADRKAPQYRKRVPFAAKSFKNGLSLLSITMIAQFERPHTQGGRYHAATASHAKTSA